MKARLEAVDSQHPETVALVVGPLVLFAVTDSGRGDASAFVGGEEDGARSVACVDPAGDVMKMMPFTAIGDQEYTTYLRVT